MWPRFGLKLGNSTVCIASVKDDFKVEVIANKHGDRVSQAVLLSDNADEIEIGLTAKQKMSTKLQSTICNSFQLLRNDITDDNYELALKYITCKFDRKTKEFQLKLQNSGTIINHKNGDDNNDEKSIYRKMTPFDVTVELFKASFELARHCHLSDDHPSVVISIPLYYPIESYENISNAAKQAGFNVTQVIPEPTAACLAYELGETNINNDDIMNKYVLCIKTGGLLTNFTLFNIINGLYTVVDSTEPFYIGGKQFTDVLVDFISKEFSKKYHLDPNESRRSMAKIRNSAENCKHILTTLQSTQIYIDSLMDGIDFNVQMSRARYENLIQPVLNEFLLILNKSLMKINPEQFKIDEIILIGGTMKIPKIQSLIMSRFSDAKLLNTLPPDEIVAIGCAKQSYYQMDDDNKIGDNLMETTLSLSFLKYDIFIWHGNNEKNKEQLIINKGTILPIKIPINVEQQNVVDENQHIEKFTIETNDKTDIIELENIKSINGQFHLQANIEEFNGLPKITIKSCI